MDRTEKECEEKLKALILEMKAEIAALRSGDSTEYPDGVSPKKKAIAAYDSHFFNKFGEKIE